MPFWLLLNFLSFRAYLNDALRWPQSLFQFFGLTFQRKNPDSHRGLIATTFSWKHGAFLRTKSIFFYISRGKSCSCTFPACTCAYVEICLKRCLDWSRRFIAVGISYLTGCFTARSFVVFAVRNLDVKIVEVSVFKRIKVYRFPEKLGFFMWSKPYFMCRTHKNLYLYEIF